MSDEDDIIQEPSVIAVAMVSFAFEHEIVGNWLHMARWVNERVPDVLMCSDYIKKKHFIFFKTNKLYLEFVQKFPVVLKGDDVEY